MLFMQLRNTYPFTQYILKIKIVIPKAKINIFQKMYFFGLLRLSWNTNSHRLHLQRVFCHPLDREACRATGKNELVALKWQG